MSAIPAQWFDHGGSLQRTTVVFVQPSPTQASTSEIMAIEPTLIERIAAGDRAAVAQCIERYSGLVWSLARRYLVNPADAEEAVQEIFIELWSKADQFDVQKAGEATFVSLMARRRLIDRLRKRGRMPEQQPLDDVEHGLSQDGHRALEASAETQRVIKVMNQMTPDQQQVIRLSAWLGMSHQAIAEQTQMPLGTVKSHLRRGLDQIRTQLGMTANDGAGLS
ncbi:MAG: sigma-70 family RNA polymerase sigma factor [Pseudomonadota bacterium]